MGKNKIYLSKSFFFIFSFIVITGCLKKRSSNFYYTENGSKKEIKIILDSIGIVKKVNANLDSLKIRLHNQGYKYIRSLTKEFIIAVPENNNTFYQSLLFQITKQLTTTNSDLIESAGLIIYKQNSEIPFFVTDEVIIEFKHNLSNLEKDSFIKKQKLKVIQQNPFHPQQVVVIPLNSVNNIFEKIISINDTNYVKYATPNFLIPIYSHANPSLDLQWYFKNTGSMGAITTGIPDADCDAELAWNFTKGRRDIIIAILDGGFEMSHPDLRPGFAINESEMRGNIGVDDDVPENKKVDDSIGWNFHGCDQNNPMICGSSDIDKDEHGTAVAGIAGAVHYIDESTSGVCPGCSILPIERGANEFAIAQAFDYSVNRGAKIISCSFGFPAYPMSSDDLTIADAVQRAIDSGVTVFIAADDQYIETCNSPNPDWVVLPNVISVSRSNNFDKFDESAYGNCINLLAPSYDQTRAGTLGIATTDLLGTEGYNNRIFSSTCGFPETIDLDYTTCFNGTSASTPLVAGIAGLILSLDPSRTPKQIQYLLQDCADKIDTTNGHYSPKNGYSNFENPVDSTAVSKTGYGRVNAYEAVKIASSDIANGGRNGVDIFLRDNILDWGNTEQPSNVLFESPRSTIAHYRSQDIKVDASDASGNFNPPANSKIFEDFMDEKPIADKINKVYVRVHNRGYRTAANVNVKLYWVYGGTALPPLWSNFPEDITGDPTWNFLGSVPLKKLQYSGASVAYTDEDLSQIATFDFLAPIPVAGQRNHYCLAAIVDSPEDDHLEVSQFAGITSLDEATPNFNNITHRNYSIIISSEPDASANPLTINNPFPFPVPAKINIINPTNIIPQISGIYVDSVFVMNPKESRTFFVYFKKTGIKYPAELTIQQEFILPGKKKRKIYGGYTFVFTK